MRAMEVKLIPAKLEDLNTILQMQIEAFSELYAKYQDTETSPATEKYEDILFRFNQSETTYYFIMAGSQNVGVIRVVDRKDGITQKRIFSRRSRSCRHVSLNSQGRTRTSRSLSTIPRLLMRKIFCCPQIRIW